MKWITEVIEEQSRKKQIEYIKNFNKEIMKPEIPRRALMTEWVKAEKAIYDAMQEVEKLSADIRLTEAVQLLAKAKDKVSDYIDELNELADTIKYNQKIK